MSKIIKNIRRKLSSGIAISAVAVACAAELVTFTDAASIISDKYNLEFGDGEKNLIVNKVRLVPWMNPERIIGTKGFDDFFIYVMLRNFGDRQLMVTSAKLEFDDASQNIELEKLEDLVRVFSEQT